MNNVFLDLGVLQIQWYSLFIFLGLFFGGTIALNESKRFNISEDFMINLFFFMVPVAIVGARLYYVAFNWSHYSNNLLEIVKVWQGGLAIHGAILLGLIWLIIYSKKYKVSTLRLLDIVVVGLLIGQAIGRWGNFFNQEAYGSVVNLTFLESLKLPKFIIDGMFINGNYYHPTFLYESIFCLIGFILILFIRRLKYIKIGHMTSFYLVWYGMGRYFIEGMRTDSLMFGDFKIAQLVSITMVVIGLLFALFQLRGSVFDNRYNEEGGFNEINY